MLAPLAKFCVEREVNVRQLLFELRALERFAWLFDALKWMFVVGAVEVRARDLRREELSLLVTAREGAER